MKNRNRELLKLYSNIEKNLASKAWTCMFNGCKEKAINSHLLQKNGVLDNAAEDKHIIQLVGNDYHKFEKDLPFSFKKIGVNTAMSYPLFCNPHDTNIFITVESSDIDLDNYYSQLLFSYRGLCAEYFKKIKGVEFYERVINANTIPMNEKPVNEIELGLNGLRGGIENLNFFKRTFEEEIIGTSTGSFIFHLFKFNPIKFCASAVFSPLESHEILKAHLNGEPLKNIMINVIPQKKYLAIIIGYHQENANKFIIDYVNSWKNLDDKQLRTKLNDLISTKIETWGIAPSILDKVPLSMQREFIKYQMTNANNLSPNQRTNFSIL